MPARTNEFQELVALIQKAVVPNGAEVTSSALETPDGLTTPREIDILIKGQFGPYAIKVAVEAKDEKRKFDVDDLGAMLAKYRGEGRVCVDKFVVVSRRGFTKGAKEKAQLADVELLTLDEAKNTDWIADPMTLRFKVNPIMVHCAIEPKPDVELSELMRKGTVVCKYGHNHGQPEAHVRRAVFRFIQSNPTRVAEVDQVMKRDGFVLATGVCKDPQFSIHYEGATYPVESYEVKFKFIDSIVKMSPRRYDMHSSKSGSSMFHHFEGTIGNQQIRIVLPADRDPEKIVIDLKSADRSRPLNRKARRAAEAKKRTQPKQPKKGRDGKGKSSP